MIQNFVQREQNKTIDVIITAIALVAIAILFFLHPVATSDLFWQLKTGELILDTSHVPLTDPFSFTAYGADWINPEWLSAVVYACLWRIGEFEALSFLSLAIGITIATLLYKTISSLSQSSSIGILLSFVTLLAGAQRFQQLRPDLFGFLFFVLMLFIFMRAHQGKGHMLWFLIPLHALWINLHPSAIVGPWFVLTMSLGLPASFSWKRRILLIAGCVGVLIINPFGIRAITYPFKHIQHSFTLFSVSDWAPPSWFHPQSDFGVWGVLLLAVICIILAIRRRRQVSPCLAIIAFYCVIPAFRMARFQPFALIALSVFLASILGRGAIFFPARAISFGRLMTLLLVFGSLLIFFRSGPPNAIRFRTGGFDLVLGLPVGVGFAEKDFPVSAVDFLDTMKGERAIFNDMSWGGYLIWRRWPVSRVFIDTRTAMYGDDFVRQYSDVLFREEVFDEVVRRYGITHVLYDARDIIVAGGPLKFLIDNPKWVPVFGSHNAVIFVKVGQAH